MQHSHKKRNNNLETRAFLIEISMLCWNLPSGPKHWGSRQRNMAFPEGKKHFVGEFCANLDETNAFYKELELEMDCLTSKILLQKLCSFKCHFCTKGWSSSYNGCAKYKENVPDVSNPNQNIETTCNSKLKFT